MFDKIDLKKWQRKVLILCWCAYAGAYLCRTNISIALPGMINSQGWTRTDAGLIGTMFFWAYAVGQLINGYIGDKVKSRLFIFIGLCASSGINLLVGFSSNLIVIIVLWGINGFFLSTLWGPIIKTVSAWFSEGKRTGVAIIMNLSVIGGYLLAWGVVGQIIVRISWRWAFWIPAAAVFCNSLVWLKKMRSRPDEMGFQIEESNHDLSIKYDKNNVSFVRIAMDTRLWLVALACIAQGVVKEGILLWAPTLLSDNCRLSPESVALFSLVIPLISIFGVLSAGWLLKYFHSNETWAINILFACSALSGLALYAFLKTNVYYVVILLSITVAMMQGANTILLAIIPLNYQKFNKISAAAGFLDFSCYIGAAAASALAGIIIDHFGWGYVIICWVVLAAFGIIFMLAANNTNKKEQGEAYVV